MGVYDAKKPSAFNALNASILVVFLILAYFGTWYLPHWYKVWAVKGVMQGVATDGYREYDDEKLMVELLRGARRLDLKVTEKNFVIKRVPYTAAEVNAVVAKNGNPYFMSRRGKFVKIAFATIIRADWPLLEGKYVDLEFHRQVEVDMAVITW